jgi:hypothetical protein
MEKAVNKNQKGQLQIQETRRKESMLFSSQTGVLFLLKNRKTDL